MPASIPAARPALYFDLGSPYAYLALERAPALIGGDLDAIPILLGAVFARRGSGSWAQTAAREDEIAEVQARAARYGLPPLVWPDPWPTDGLRAMRAATWAASEGRGLAFAREVFRAGFQTGADITAIAVLAACAAAAGLDAETVPAAVADPAVKTALRTATDAAWAAGVRGVPTVVVSGRVFYGDDHLDAAAAATAAP